jgi:hypothetical protein
MTILHIGILFPIKNAKVRILCGAKSDCYIVLGVDSRHNLSCPEAGRRDGRPRFCRHCATLMQKIQPIGKTLWRLIRSAAEDVA